MEYAMTTVTVQLTEQQVKMLKARTGKKTTAAALKAWIARSDPKRSTVKLQEALRQSLKEDAAGKGRSFASGKEAIRWLES